VQGLAALTTNSPQLKAGLLGGSLQSVAETADAVTEFASKAGMWT